eukprot:TRINITY_DN5841_c0_g2_i1.p1 TRINITY_DN5841_c0_g2~~TRINITY_DN5841_c0_g2_i1.p1  ORF type:complete len:489 (-),score=72.88 TRINITY_DN5841_c0_g2_i1:156-1622(-)
MPAAAATEEAVDASRATRLPSPSPDAGGYPEQASQQHAGAQQGSLGALLELWRGKRSATESICQEEKQALTDVIFATMPQGRVKIISMERIQQRDLLGSFCEEERSSQLRERDQHKKHKEFMLLHGTRWEIAPIICTAGLDPDCGHLSKGIWLGQSAESAHSYAAKGPGPELEPGRMLFTMLAVAVCPNRADGDEERSFGVWRIMARTRMYPAYLVVYSAPLDVRARRPSPSPRMNKSVEMLLQLREDLQSPGGKRANSPGRLRRRSDELMLPRSPQAPWPDGRNSFGRNNIFSVPPQQPASSKCPGSSPDALDGESPQQMRSPRSPAGCPKPPDGCVDKRAHSPCRRCHSQSSMGIPADPQRRAATQNSDAIVVTHGARGIGFGSGSPQRLSPAPAQSKPPAQCTSAAAASSWEVQLDSRWVPLLPGTKLNDQAGMKQDIVNGQFWYRLIFHDNGTTGMQVNLSTGKTRPLRRVNASQAAMANDSKI